MRFGELRIFERVPMLFQNLNQKLTWLASMVLFASVVKRLSFKWVTLLVAVGIAVLVERNRRINKKRALELQRVRRFRRTRLEQTEPILMLIRESNGLVTPVRPSHLALMLREGDFTAEDYEQLLRLDDDVPRPRSAGASQDTINAIQSHQVSPSMQEESCCICLESLQLGEKYKKLACPHLFHDTCLDKWLQVKASCPLCQQHA